MFILMIWQSASLPADSMISNQLCSLLNLVAFATCQGQPVKSHLRDCEARGRTRFFAQIDSKLLRQPGKLAMAPSKPSLYGRE